jgi:hypothetical protein
VSLSLRILGSFSKIIASENRQDDEANTLKELTEKVNVMLAEMNEFGRRDGLLVF